MEKITFNLVRALAGDKVITRNGLSVTELHVFETRECEFKLCAIVNGDPLFFKVDGSYGGVYPHSFDLFMAPRTVTKWVNVYRNNIDGEKLSLHETEDEAKTEAQTTPELFNRKFVATTSITWEE